MAEKPLLEESTHPPLCPHCQTPLQKLQWHKVKGGPSAMGYIALISCGACRTLVGTVGA
jgi:hypothetical protein